MIFMFELVVSAITTLAFLFLLVTSIGIKGRWSPWISPGAFPAILSAIVLIASILWFVDTLVLFIKSRNTTGNLEENNSEKKIFHLSMEGKRLAEIIILTILYIMVLMPLLGFAFATLIFLFVAVKLFYGKTRMAFIVSVSTALAIFVLFRFLLLLPMPR